MTHLPDAPEDLMRSEPGFLVVGLGASAGGIEALREFFAHVPADSGAAYVVILHLSPDHESRLAQILQTVTPLPVTQVSETARVAPNHVYVVAPNQHLTMAGDDLAMSPNTLPEERRAPVDIFFRTLAETHYSRAVCVVLSGTGADGSMGLKRVKEHGGVVFVQNPREAAFSEMPRNAIATDLADDVLPVAAIPARIVAYRASLGTLAIPLEAGQRPAEQQQALREIFTQLRVHTGHDFSNYKRPTLLRRIARRVNVRGLPSLPAYAAFLRETPDEVQALLKDLLISVTNFFRDKEAFAALEREIIPRLFAGKRADEQVRIWVAGCATGEEAYSIAMLCAEHTLGASGAPSVQIFASDIDEAAIAHARRGLYSANDAADVSPERLRRFFALEDQRYRVRGEIREMVLFATHNVLKDPPFSHLDLVTCRNMLIYLNHAAQERVIETLHFALRPGGYLFLGSSESVDGSNDLFSAVSREQRIFQRRTAGARVLTLPEAQPLARAPLPLPQASLASPDEPADEQISYAALHMRLIEEYAPPSLVVDQDFQIVHLSKGAGRYLEIAAGEPTTNLLELIRPELRLALRSALYQAAKRQSNIDTSSLTIGFDTHPETVTVRVRPMPRQAKGAGTFLLVLFEPGAPPPSGAEPVVHAESLVTQQLEDEVQHLRQQLNTTSEQYELQAEELRATNEELHAMNEELRSSAEELETSKEELQSINEELRTVNQELKVKIEEATLHSTNLQNLVNSTNIGTIFLDRRLRIKLFTPAARELFNLIAADYGRPLADITHRLLGADVLADAASVLADLRTIEREARASNGKVYLLSVLPYRDGEDRIGGVVLTFFDITERKEHERQQEFLLKLSDALRPLADAIEIQMTVTRTAMDFFKADRAYYCEIEDGNAIIRRDASRGDLPSVAGVYPLDSLPLFTATMNMGRPLTVRDSNATDAMDEELKQLCIQLQIIAFINVPVIKNGEYAGNLCITQNTPRAWTDFEIALAEEIAERTWAAVERARAETALRESEQLLRALSENLPGGAAFVVDRNLRYLLVEGEALHAVNLRSSDLVGKTIFEALDPATAASYETNFRHALAGRPFLHEHTDRGHYYITRGTPLYSPQGEVYAVLAASFDITDRKRAEDALRDSEARFRTLANTVPQVIWTNDAAGEAIYFNQRWYEYSGLDYEQSAGLGWQAIVHPDDAPASVGRWQRALAAGAQFDTEYRLRRSDGAYRWFIGRNVPLRNDSGQVAGWFGSATDIEDLKQAEAALRASEEKFRLLVDGARDYAMFLLGAENLITFWSSGAERVFGWSQAEALGQSGALIFTPEDRAGGAVEREIRTAMAKGRAEDRRWHLRKDGSRLFVDGMLVRLDDPAGDVRGFVKIARDATAQRHAEDMLQQAHDELEQRVQQRTAELAQLNMVRRELLQRLVTVQEDERRRIARELHDSLGQFLVAVRLNLTQVQTLCDTMPEVQARIGHLLSAIGEIDDELDRLTAELRPTVLDDLGLHDALEFYAQQWSESSGIAIEYLATGLDATRMPITIEASVYRIVQEALTNVSKHAQARQVNLLIQRHASELRLVIADDGVGFDPEATARNRSGGQQLGLVGMAERASLLGGSMTIESAPGAGTAIYVNIPLDGEQSGA